LFKNKTKFKGSLKLGGGVAMIEKGVDGYLAPLEH